MKETEKTFGLAKLAKEIGFTTQTVSTGFTNKYLLGGKNVMINEICIFLWLCELQKWLRDNHSIYTIVEPHFGSQPEKILFVIKKVGFLMEGFKSAGIVYKSYEEALEESLTEAIKLIKL